MWSVFHLILLVLAHSCLGNEIVSYKNYKLYQVQPNSIEALNELKNLDNSNLNYVFVKSHNRVGVPIDIAVSPHNVLAFEKFLTKHEINFKIIVTDLQEVIDKERVRPQSAPGIDWNSYYNLDEINYWLEDLTIKYPDKVRIVKGGSTYEGRDIVGVHVSFNESNSNNAVFIEGNIHAAEWISNAVSTYFLNELLTSSNASIRDVAESYDWYIFPVINPDGFAYTHSTDRLWRKTRVPHGECVGADPNRNWNYHWNDGGTSNDSCAHDYCGPQPFSEPCTKTLAEYISTIGDKLVGYISFHSYSQLLMIPYGYTTEHLDNFDELYSIGVKAAESLAQRYGTQYKVGSIAEIIYLASGGSIDWIKGVQKVPLTYTYELPDTGEYGFLLPPSKIIPVCEETLDSLLTIFQEYKKLH